MFFLHMNNVSEPGVQFRCVVGRQVAHGSAVTVFLQSCESDSQWVVHFFYASEASGSVLAPAGWTRVSSHILPPPPPPLHSLFRLNQELSGIQTLSFIQ